MRPQAQAPNNFVPSMVASSDGKVLTGTVLSVDEIMWRAIAQIIPAEEYTTREEYLKVWSSPHFRTVVSKSSDELQRRALDPLIANFGKPTQEVHRAILRVYRDIHDQPLPMAPQTGPANQAPQIIQGNDYATYNSGDPDVRYKCSRCRLKHRNSDPCDRFMNEFDVRMMLDQLRNVPPANTEPQKVKAAETYLRDKLKKISAARRAAEVI
jgi:hypothetical protein